MPKISKKAKHNTDQEFPVLARLGLYAGNITGDGNCLFRALSDQLFGFQDRYAEVRAQVVEYILAHKERFEPFTGVYDETFDHYTRRMAEDATYGGHLEIVAFAEVHKLQVMIYQGEIKYAVSPADNDAEGKIHIAYHTWEHYSSVRNKAGPHSGLPAVDPNPSAYERPELDTSSGVPQWQIDIVTRSVPDVSEEVAEKKLRTKSYEEVIEELLLGEDACDVQDAAAVHDTNESVGSVSQPALEGTGEPEPASTANEQNNADAPPDPEAANTKPTPAKRKPNKSVKKIERKLAKKKEKAKRKIKGGGEQAQKTDGGDKPGEEDTDAIFI